MELHKPPRGSVCLPFPARLRKLDLRQTLRRAGHRTTDAVRRGTAPVRAGLCGAVGAAAGTAVSFLGMDLTDSVSFGMNVAATAAAFWPSNGPATGRTEVRTEGCI
ncbi:hypothetical protein ABZ923_40455 [Streptomyces sp. NPDC046881]|uniref:hypothetical protein n=1 Tax=Streptomyces sp. NPDC046881 TaxID=3155374 RepID=UPI0033DA3FF5